MFCIKCNARLLTIEEIDSRTGMCEKCQKKHVEEFHEKYDIKENDNE